MFGYLALGLFDCRWWNYMGHRLPTNLARERPAWPVTGVMFMHAVAALLAASPIPRDKRARPKIFNPGQLGLDLIPSLA